MSEASFPLFADLNLSEPLLRVLKELGYEAPSPIQAATIPLLLDNKDVLGQAQTGTGKTAAFALPILSRIDIKQSTPQALVLAPTRELAIQVAEAFQRYASHIPGFHVLPIYGGQSYMSQLSALRRGVHVVVGTPGRVIDHLEKGSLDLSKIKTMVLDEADEMLRMGFIDDVETILQKTPESRQTALFSATMPSAIKRIATTYLRDPELITVAAKTGTADNIRQRYWLVSGMQKLEALTRILEAETFDGMIIFARTKLGTEELASKLQARGFSAAAINGDIQQQQRERTIQQLKDGKIDILVATDVAARGLDVERISHVINYDVPHDPESYTHRIGRTGRAGRSGEAILFIAPRERNLLKAIERATRQPISVLELPTVDAVNDVRISKFKEQIAETIAAGGLEVFHSLIEEYEREHNVPAVEIAAALAKLARGDVPLLIDKNKPAPRESWGSDKPVSGGRFERAERFERNERPERSERFERPERAERSERSAAPRKERVPRAPDEGMQTFRIEVGHAHGVKPGNIVGAIANEANLDSKYIGRIEIYDDYSTLDLPNSLPSDMLDHLKKVWVAGQQLNITADGEASAQSAAAPAPKKAAPAQVPFSDRPARSDFAAHFDKPAQAESRERPARTERLTPAAAASVLKESYENDEPLVKVPGAQKKERTAQKKAGAVEMEAFRIEVGHDHGVKPANIVGAIANEAGLEAKYIGRIEIFDRHTLLDLPAGMPDEVFAQLKNVSISGNPLRISHSGLRPMEEKTLDKRVTIAPPSKGGDRRVAEKARGGKPVSKRVAVASGKSFDAPRSASKPSTGPSGKPMIKLGSKRK
ncbi:DEAD/DEAH box helicase [Herminiimonas fonticola]|uniref:ATP-dependent RNA helicase DeaD n=1 Tax=Herminiimonas fonticola TaxID=303380 RepID=A0A4R6GHN1_9BURK|nr:DEAD/DEAH box helicase [Herminiimonas fonticola]RBA24756.1 DEAD/DEAH box helicase [Herminiimonas fonticola]TDN93870.1 ATP-dependent RNA helicase CsdA [Herminiimonas fonticola]